MSRTTLSLHTNDYARKGDRKYVGVFLPLPIYVYTTLFSFASATTRTSLFEGIFEEWMEKTVDDNSIDDLCKKIATRAVFKWKKKKKKDIKESLKKFKEELIYELEYKCLPVDIIKKILIHFNNGTK